MAFIGHRWIVAKKSYYHTNHQGSVIAMTNAAGTFVQELMSFWDVPAPREDSQARGLQPRKVSSHYRNACDRHAPESMAGTTRKHRPTWAEYAMTGGRDLTSVLRSCAARLPRQGSGYPERS